VNSIYYLVYGFLRRYLRPYWATYWCTIGQVVATFLLIIFILAMMVEYGFF
jgi:hypothetical protein